MPRPTILTQAALARVVSLIAHGRSAAEIAREMGCTLGTLRVRCSQNRISLRRAKGSPEDNVTAMKPVPSGKANAAGRRKSVDRVKQNRTVSGSSVEAWIELKVLLPRFTAEQLRDRGALRGISGSALAAELLVTIARDDLCDAVLDAG
jgi:transposase-like protein